MKLTPVEVKNQLLCVAAQLNIEVWFVATYNQYILQGT